MLEKLNAPKFQQFLAGSSLLLLTNIVENHNSLPFQVIENATGSTIPIAILGTMFLTAGLGLTLPFWWSQVKRMRGTEPFSLKRKQKSL